MTNRLKARGKLYMVRPSHDLPDDTEINDVGFPT